MDIYATKYVPLAVRPMTSEERSHRDTARDLKTPTPEAIDTASAALARLIDGPCYLVPVPDSKGGLAANLELARAIAKLVPGARVKIAVGRSHPVESSCARRLRGQAGLTIEEHAITRTAGPMLPLPVHFVDNIATTGNTIAACRRALGWGSGLTYADASTRTNQPSL